MKPPKLLIDADYFLYRAANAAEEELEFDPDLTLIVGDFKHGKRVVEFELDKLRTKFETTDIVLFFTDKVNFRKEVDATYKGNRIKRKPCGYLKLKKWAMETYKSIMKPGLEADDSLGIMATSGKVDNFILVSPDKDMEQIPCRIFNLKEEFTQTPEAAKRKLYEQILTGDQTDGYGGCPGVGPKRAGIILDKCKGDYWPAIVEAYETAGLTEEDAIRTANLARILQVSDWDSDGQKPIPFTP